MRKEIGMVLGFEDNDDNEQPMVALSGVGQDNLSILR